MTLQSAPDLFDYGARLRDAGMARAADAEPCWAADAYAALVELARIRESIHIDDFLRFFPRRPAHPNAAGSIWMRARKNKIIEPTGLIRPCRVDNFKHSHSYPIYSSLIYRA